MCDCQRSEKKNNSVIKVNKNMSVIDRDGNYNVKVTLVGSSSVGKTSLLNVMQGYKMDSNHQPTVGGQFNKIEREFNGKTFTFQVWDTAGAEAYTSILPTYIRGSHVMLICYSGNDEETFNDVKNKWVENVSAILNLDETIVIIVETKNDLDIVVDSKEVEEYCKNKKFDFISTSSVTLNNIQTILSKIAEKVKEKYDKN